MIGENIEIIMNSSDHINSRHTKKDSKKTNNNNNNIKVVDNYQIIKQIGAGSFGEVYLAKNKNGDIRAAKVEYKDKNEKLINEYKIYKYLHHKGMTEGIPKIYNLIETPTYNLMFMEVLGNSLEDIFKVSKLFNTQSVLSIAIQSINILQQVHSNNYIHRDIKPGNFLIGINNNKHKLYLLDYGLSKKYLSHGQHIPFRKDRSMIGTSRYASCNMHRGFEPSRRDDLESLGHMLIYFAKGCLPWQGLRKKRLDNEMCNAPTLSDVKLNTTLDELCKNTPSCLKEYLQYCRNLEFEEEPNYKAIIKIFTNFSKLNNIDVTLEFK